MGTQEIMPVGDRGVKAKGKCVFFFFSFKSINEIYCTKTTLPTGRQVAVRFYRKTNGIVTLLKEVKTTNFLAE